MVEASNATQGSAAKVLLEGLLRVFSVMEETRHGKGLRHPIIHLQDLRDDDRRQNAKVTSIFQRLPAHGLFAKIPRSHKWRTTRFGRRVMAAAILVKTRTYPELIECRA